MNLVYLFKLSVFGGTTSPPHLARLSYYFYFRSVFYAARGVGLNHTWLLLSQPISLSHNVATSFLLVAVRSIQKFDT